MAIRLSDYRVISFDCYGTLIPWESGIWDALQPLILENSRAGSPTAGMVDRQSVLKVFGEVESEVESHAPNILYSEVLERVHRGLAERLGFETRRELDTAFGESRRP